MTRASLLVLAALSVCACTRPIPAPQSDISSASSAVVQSAPAPITSAPTPSTALRAEIVPVIGGLFPVAKPDPAGVPVSTTLVLRVHNDSDAPVVLRTGGDDEGFEITVRGSGVVSTKGTTPCNELWAFGAKHAIAPHGSLDVPLRTLHSGARCQETAHYLTTPGLYEMDVSLRAHVHASDAPPNKGERGTEIVLTAPKVTLRAG